MKVFVKYKDTGSEFIIKFRNKKELDSYLSWNNNCIDYWKFIEE